MKEIYQWVDWFEELAKKIANNEPNYLLERARRIPWTRGENTTEFKLFQYGEQNVDPFSFIYTLASKATRFQYKRVFEAVSKEFNLSAQLSLDQYDDRFVFPTPDSRASLFHVAKDFEPDSLRELFTQAVNRPESVDESFFNRAFAIKRVGIHNLTQTLFLISPRTFFPIDQRFREALGERFSLPKRQSEFSWSNYKKLLVDLKDAFNCEYYELNLWLYLSNSKKLVNNQSIFHQISLNKSSDDKWNASIDQGDLIVDVSDRVEPFFEQIKRGDIVLVRQGSVKAKGMGIVLEKEHRSSTESRYRFHLIWMNKQEANFLTKIDVHQFSRAGEVEQHFRNIDSYDATFEILDRFIQREPARIELQNVVVDTMPRNTIIFGPPGTGKTWEAERRAVQIVDGHIDEGQYWRERFKTLYEQERIEFVTFHQNYGYEDFIEGIRPIMAGSGSAKNVAYDLKPGIFKKLCSRAEANQLDNYVLLIDELNRGNIAKIFGELISLIEESRRIGSRHETRVKLPISGDIFGVPNNLYIIGTMNTADRSIQLLDTALRRRFRFVELMPNLDHKKIASIVDDINVSKLLRIMNQRIVFLLDREHQIGHTYFFDIDVIDDLAHAFKYRIFPLLQEYFFDDWSKIQVVLGDNGFVETREVSTLVNENEFDVNETCYEHISFSDERWTQPECYRRIYNNSG